MKTGIANNSKLRRLAGALGLLLALSLLVSLGPTWVLAVPPQPHQFYGNVTICGAPAPEGTVVSARIGGIEYASTTVDAEGRYGYDPLFKVPADDPDTPEKEGGVAGETVEFYVGDELAGQYEYEYWGVTELDLEAPAFWDLTVTSDGCCPITVEYDGVSEEVAADETRTFADIPCCTDVTLTAVVPEGCEFVEWSGDIAPNAPTDNPITIHMDSDKSVTAYCKSICVGPPWPVTLESGWNLLSTPILLDADSDTLEQIFDAPSLANIEVSYRWDIVEQQWRQVLADFELLPLEGIYVKIKPDATATATFVPSEELSGPPSRGLVEGLNLIGPAPPYEACEFPAMPLDQALVSIEEAPGGLRGYTMVISPGLNQPGWTYSLGGEIKDLLPYKGYWVVMENADTLYGFSTTPVP